MEEKFTPQVIVKLWAEKPGKQKTRLADEIIGDVMDVLGYGEGVCFVAPYLHAMIEAPARSATVKVLPREGNG